MVRAAIHFLALALALGGHSEVFGCSCIARTTTQEHVEAAAHIFVGRLLKTESIEAREEPKGWPGVAGIVELRELIKSTTPPPPRVITGVGSGDCGVPMYPALAYVFFAGPKGEIDICSGTRPYVKGNEEHERYLNDVRALATFKSAP